MTKTMYQLVVPKVPGAQPSVEPMASLKAARAAAREYHHRRDLTWQDVRIVKSTVTQKGTKVETEYAGPSR